MRLSADLLAFQGRIGHTFRKPELLARALTHASISSLTRASNERLEFLGDRVLALAMAEALSTADTSATEGQLAPRLNALVRLETCADVARDVGLGEVLKLGRSEMISGGRRKDALLGDALEAVIAAVHLDAGFDAARALVLRIWGDRIAAISGLDARDAKSALQEWAQGRGLAPPTYTEMARSGPDHQPQFTVQVTLDGLGTAEATAGTKRSAEQAVARLLMQRMEDME